MEGGIYQFKRCDGLLLCKLIVSPGRSAALHKGMGERSLFGSVCPHADAPCALTEPSGYLSGTCFRTSPKGHTRHVGLGLMLRHKPSNAAQQSITQRNATRHPNPSQPCSARESWCWGGCSASSCAWIARGRSALEPLSSQGLGFSGCRSLEHYQSLCWKTCAVTLLLVLS